MSENIDKTELVRQGIHALQEEIILFVDKLKAFESGEQSLPMTEIVTLLDEVGQGSLSCAALLKCLAFDGNQNSPSQDDLPIGKLTILRIDIRMASFYLAEGIKLLTRIKRNWKSLSADEKERNYQQIQEVIHGLSTAWKDFS